MLVLQEPSTKNLVDAVAQEVVDADKDVVEADKDKASIRACQT